MGDSDARHSVDALLDSGVRIEPVGWELIYPVRPRMPIGRIRRRRDGFHAKLADGYLCVYTNGDAAAEATWQRFLEASAVRDARAAVTTEVWSGTPLFVSPKPRFE